MGKHARLAHLHDFSDGSDAQAFQPNLGSERQSRIHNGRFCLLTFVGPTRHGGDFG